jgi:hypothetical protein
MPMTEEQLSALLEYIDARIDEKIREASGRDSLSEGIHADILRGDLKAALGIAQ